MKFSYLEKQPNIKTGLDIFYTTTINNTLAHTEETAYTPTPPTNIHTSTHTHPHSHDKANIYTTKVIIFWDEIKITAILYFPTAANETEATEMSVLGILCLASFFQSQASIWNIYQLTLQSSHPFWNIQKKTIPANEMSSNSRQVV